MNTIEHKMVDILKNLRDNHSVTGIKAEFEAEGTRIEEAMRLKEVVMKAEIGLTIKIGGCEALRDMYECRTIGVERVVAPMIESAFALSKFIKATKLAFPDDERKDIKFAVNIETKAGYKNFNEMLLIPEINLIDGIVLGRVDLTGSLGMSRDDINTDTIFEIAKDVFSKSNAKGLENAIGGGVSAESLPFFQALPTGHLNRFETRKVIFNFPDAMNSDPEKGILKAVGFELLWLRNKRDYYNAISIEDETRLNMLEKRYRTLIEKAGGQVE